jgi:hypothetical protein
LTILSLGLRPFPRQPNLDDGATPDYTFPLAFDLEPRPNFASFFLEADPGTEPNAAHPEEIQKTLSNVLKMLTDGSYTGAHFAMRINDLIGAEVEMAKRNDFCGDTETMGGGAVVRMDREVPKALEEL